METAKIKIEVTTKEGDIISVECDQNQLEQTLEDIGVLDRKRFVLGDPVVSVEGWREIRLGKEIAAGNFGFVRGIDRRTIAVEVNELIQWFDHRAFVRATDQDILNHEQEGESGESE